MISAEKFNLKGESEKAVALPKEVFGVKASAQLMAQSVRVYLANQRKARAKTKTRGEVAKTTAKMYKQKGTGRARHGSYSSPIFVGGGVALGPTGQENWKLKMPKQMTKLALAGALSNRAKDKKVVILGGADKASGKVTEMKELSKKLTNGKQKWLLVTTAGQKQMAKAWRNRSGVMVRQSERLNAYEVMINRNIVITDEALAALVKKYAN